MEDENAPPRRPIRWNALRTDEAERVVREIARDRERVVLTGHAWDRMEERSILYEDVLDILRTGHVGAQPERTAEGDWKVVVTKPGPGRREAEVVAVIVGRGGRLDLVTVEWRDTWR